MVVITERELGAFRQSVRSFYKDLSYNGNVVDVEKINELLKIHKLRKEDIIDNYTVKYVRQ